MSRDAILLFPSPRDGAELQNERATAGFQSTQTF